MNSSQVKEYLREDVERIEKVLESIGVHSIWRTGSEVRGAPKDSDNNTAVAVNFETLYSVHYSTEVFRGDIFQLIQHFRNVGFGEAFRHVCSLFGLGSSFTKEEKEDPLAVFKSIRKRHRVAVDIDSIEVPKFGNEALSEFVMLPHINFFYEGITPQTQEIFRIGYSHRDDRIVIPHFNYDDKDAIVGITGRTLKSKEEMKAFNIPKYYNFIKGYRKMYNLYGFSHSKPYIEENKVMILFESEKSVMKQWSMTRNRGFSSSVGGHELSDAQVQIILRNTPMDTEIVIAYDKDIMDMTDDRTGEKIGEKYLIDTCNKLSKYRKTSYIWDTHNLLGDKDSPVDKGVKVWNFLFKYRKSI